MPDRAVLQPNGRWAIFSSYVDHFTAFNGTRDEVLNAFREEFRTEADRNAEGKMTRAEARESAKPGADFKDAIESVATVHGFDTAEQLRVQLSEPSRDAGHVPPQAEPDRSLPPELAARIKEICMDESRTFRLEHPRIHATGPLVKPERKVDIISFRNALDRICEAYGVKLKADMSGSLLIIDQKTTLPDGYDCSAWIERSGVLKFAEHIVEPESEAKR